MLARLARNGLLESSWEDEPPEGRPRRHLYRLSAAGAEFATNLSMDRPGHRARWLVPDTGRV